MTSSHHEQQLATTSVIEPAMQVLTYDSEKTVALFYVTQPKFDWQNIENADKLKVHLLQSGSVCIKRLRNENLLLKDSPKTFSIDSIVNLCSLSTQASPLLVFCEMGSVRVSRSVVFCITNYVLIQILWWKNRRLVLNPWDTLTSHL